MTRTFRETYDAFVQADEKYGAYVQAMSEVPSKDEVETANKLNDEVKALEEGVFQYEAGQKLRQQYQDRATTRNTPQDNVGFGTPGDSPSGKAGSNGPRPRTLGEAFTEDREIKAWRDSLVSNGGFISEKQRLQSPVFRSEGKALITGTSDTSAGALMQTDYQPLVSLPFRTLTVRDVITNGRTNSDIVSFPRITSQTNAAAPVAEATASSGDTGLKPESAMALEIATADVKTIAHWMPATKRALSDAAQIRTIVDSFLMYGLEEELEDQIIAGSGVGENLTGIFNTTGTSTQAWDTNLLTTTRKAVTVALVTGKAKPNAWLMTPLTSEQLDLLQDNEARYYYGGPQVLGNQRLWGYPIVVSEAVTTGFALFGDLRQAVLWVRENPSIQVTDSHADFFIRNLVAVLAEMRAAFGVLRPAAIVEVDVAA